MEENIKHNFEIVKKLQEIAKEKNCTTAQLALAWVLAQRDSIVPIPGTKKVKYLEENVLALKINLSDEDLKRLDEAAPIGFTKGPRYPERAMSGVNR
jgi:aryl-alcohol dehydrogenase-like predicted oxidoreductase